MRAALILLLALALAACAGNDAKLPPPVAVCPVATDVVETVRNVYVPLPDRVTRPVADPGPGEPTSWGDAVLKAERRGALLEVCNGQLREASELQGRAIEGD